MSDDNVLDKKFQKELNSGITALILLGVLSHAAEPMYGYQIAKLIEAQQIEVPLLKQGVLYPALRSLDKSELVQSQVEPSVSGPPRRYYQITEMGQETLNRWAEIWKQTISLTNNILEGENDDQ